MSITIIQAPQTLEPVYTKIPVVVSSISAITTANYEFIFDLYQINTLTGAATFLNRNKMKPLPDGTCVYSPASLLRSSVDYEFDPFGSGFTSVASSSIIKYKILFGEEYPVSLYFSSIQSASTGYAQLNFDSNHGLSSGDTVYVYKANSSVNSSYNGYHSILQVNNSSAVTINSTWYSAVTETGYITSVLRMVTSPQVTGKTAFSCARQYKERTRNYFKEFNLTGNNTTFLNTYSGSTIPTIRIGTDEVYTLGGYSNDSSYNFDSVIITTYTGQENNYQVKGIYSTLISGLNSNYDLIDFKCGTRNLAQTKDTNFLSPFGYDTIYTSDITQYKIAPYDSGSGTIGEHVFFKVKDECTAFEPKRIAWQNKLGRTSYWTFNGKNIISYDVDRKVYTKVLDYNYSIGDRGTTVLSLDTTKYLTVNTGWICDYDSKFLTEEMFFSPEIYLLNMEDETKEPLTIIDKKIVPKNYLNDRLFYLTFTFEFSNNPNNQNG
jgi:hypothetical protein